MSKRPRIKWQQSDNQELTKAVKNFNAKITRIEKKNPELKNALPERMSVRQLKELINTRQDLKRELNALKRFTDKSNVIDIEYDGDNKKYIGIEIIKNKNDYNTKITKWQKKEINRRLGFINKRRAERLKMIEETDVTSRGKNLGYTRGELGIGRAEILELKPLTGITEGANEVSIKKKYQSILIQSQSDFYTLKDYRCKENYITGLYDNFNSEEIKDIISTIENMPIDKFLETFNSDPDAKFSGLYAPSKSKEREYQNKLRAVWLPNR